MSFEGNEILGVRVINLPYVMNDDWTPEFDETALRVVRALIEEIPEDIRPALILDFLKIPKEVLKETKAALAV
ncbi:MAG: hypothetical protein BSOLF_2914 [Candidatus Carbobacillus altaicus]|uniref:Uncharacterized protein n=1 Tax=Candidatus Carbonibacillus altaicus TaxID=2163959 RepID=A0A2R6XXQ9_9BACL|nr:MAG: hypothetical protein BSOLF_2914 [Candidatus Carbobacillus altaicus]